MNKQFEINSGNFVLSLYTSWDRHPQLIEQLNSVKASDLDIKILEQGLLIIKEYVKFAKNVHHQEL